MTEETQNQGQETPGEEDRPQEPAQAPAPLPPRVPVAAGSAPTPIVPTNMDEAYRMAVAVVRAGMVPYGIDTPEKAMIAIMTGLELGLPPMRALQSIAIVNGRPLLWGDPALALVRASGLLDHFEEGVSGDGDERFGFCNVRRKGDPVLLESKFSVAEAKKASLWSPEARVTKRAKGGGTYEKDNDSPWHRYPDRMLKMRARGFALRDKFADVLCGLSMREEYYGIEDAIKGPPAPPVDPFAGEGPRQIADASQAMQPITEPATKETVNGH